MKTNELTGPALDWAVAKAEGKLITLFCGVMVRNGPLLSPSKADPLVEWSPSTSWAQGGPIIERERVTLDLSTVDYDEASDTCIHLDPPHWWSSKGEITARGPSPLVAAMRCYVATKLGDEVEIPEELL